MTAPNLTAPAPYVHPLDPAGYLKPGDTLMSGGYDFSWCYVWIKEIPGYPRFRVSSVGNLWSRKANQYRRSSKWAQVRGNNQDGYARVTTGWETRDRKFIHELVLYAFVGPCPPGMCCRHLNGNPGDNRIDNLRWGTQLENMADKKIHGTQTRGSMYRLAKLSEADVEEIHRRVAAGQTYRDIAKHFGIHHSRITRIARGQEWAHVEGNDATRALVGVDTRVGSLNRSAKLTEDDVREIRRLWDSGVGQTRIGPMYGINPATVSRIVNRKKWAHVK